MRSVAPERRSCWLQWMALSYALVLGGCIVSGDRCDAHQVKIEEDGFLLCVCEPDAAPNSSGVGCTPCGENREVQNGVCACKAGFVPNSDGNGCVASDIGAPCDAEGGCTDSFPYCVADKTQPYCSSTGCSSSADCAGGWTCEVSNDTRYCRKPITGLGVQCTSNDHCAGFEANYCENIQTHTCILQGCAVRDVVCPSEWLCCDYSALLGAALSTCISPSQVVSGACPQGGKQVDQ